MPTEINKKPTLSGFFADLLLGAVSGAMAKTVSAPLTRIKLVLQTQDANLQVLEGHVSRYQGILDCSVRIYREQGIRRFWDGNLVACMSYFPTTILSLALKDTFKKAFPTYNPKTEFPKFFATTMVSSSMAALGSLSVMFPITYARTRLATDVGPSHRAFSGFTDCIAKTMKGSGGFFALYTGFGAALAGTVVHRGLQLGAFDCLTGLNPYRGDKGILGAVTTFTAAQTAILMSASATYPFDTVRCRLQMQAERQIETHIYNGTLHCFKRIASEEGLLGLYKGFSVNLLSTVGGSLLLVSYDRAKAYYGL